MGSSPFDTDSYVYVSVRYVSTDWGVYSTLFYAKDSFESGTPVPTLRTPTTRLTLTKEDPRVVSVKCFRGDSQTDPKETSCPSDDVNLEERRRIKGGIFLRTLC